MAKKFMTGIRPLPAKKHYHLHMPRMGLLG